MIRKILALLTILVFFSPLVLLAQNSTTGIAGKVTDAQTGEALPFVQVGFVGTKIGTSTDMDGKFRIANNDGVNKVRFQMMGYEPLEMTITKGKMKTGAKITLTPKSNVMQEVVVTAKKKRNRYRRRNNPAVELVQHVIDNKDKNRLQAADRYSVKVYDKTILALDDFHPDFENKKLWRKFSFLQKYIDETPFDATKIMTVSLHENMYQQSFRKKPKQQRTLTTAKRMDGLDQIFGKEGIDMSLKQVFVPIDIYDNDIELMLNHFTSPLNTTLATTFYKYYITDTVEIEGVTCVELSFVPLNIRSYGFTGQMYIALDSTYAVTRYSMTVSKHVNLNFVRDLTIIQSYKHNVPTVDSVAGDSIAGKPSNQTITQSSEPPVPPYIPDRCDTYGRMYVQKRLQELYAHQVRIFYNYDITPTTELLPDSLFANFTNVASLPKTKMRRREWNRLRPIELNPKETVIDSMRYELLRLPEIRFLKHAIEISITGFVSSTKNRDSSYFDMGPIYNFLSYNHEEGWRFRFGGMTTARISKRNFAEGYLAYGTRDKRPKFSLDLIHTFSDREHHSHELPLNLISFTAAYDVLAPGRYFDESDRDNIFASTDKPHKIQYVGETRFRFKKEWPCHIRVDTWVAARTFESSGNLKYLQYQPDGSLKELKNYNELEWRGKLTFSPNLEEDVKRPGGVTLLNLKNDAPTISLGHNVGAMQGGFRYQITTFDADKRFWLGAFGHIDAKLKSGIIWNRVPYIKLYFPNGNDSWWLYENAFNSMKPSEFLCDQYVSLMTSYHLKGWLLSNVPFIKRFRLREIVGFNIIYGGLSAKNNPNVGDNVGLFVLPQGTKPLGDTPYMEYSIGIENIFRFIRIDFIRRLTYDEGMKSRDKNFFRIAFQFSI